MAIIIYRIGDESMLDEIRPLWEALNRHHHQSSENFKTYFEKNSFETRRMYLLKKAQNGQLRIEIAVDRETSRNVGVCISRIEFSGNAEIESIYVLEKYRGLGLGQKLFRNAIDWMDEKGVHTKTVSVAAGNEQALTFYERFGFYPKRIQLEQRK
ncbi:GNAT family N-acetyltransferase [Eubacteriaceae bacterium ES2]|nr:GNAT family N-acetyltransferase [Eubacteriaceae bacterium ES2]